MTKVLCLIPCRDGEKTLGGTLNRLLNQKGVDVQVIVANDASVDGTLDILKEYKKTYGDLVDFITYPKREPRNYNRVPILINMAWERATKEYDFYMISADDNLYPYDYMSKILAWMEEDKVDLASGFNTTFKDTKAPTGGGRLVTPALFKMLMPLPNRIGWDTWMLQEAMMQKKTYSVYPIKKHHMKLRRFIFTFGYVAHMHGTPFVWTLLRSLMMMKRTKRPLRALSVVMGHIEYSLRGVPQADEELVAFNRKTKLGIIFGGISRRLSR